MTVKEAINELDALTMREFSEKTKAAIRKGVSILEKLEKKEPALQEAKTSSNKNFSIDNDNTILKMCQEFFRKTMRVLDKAYQTMSQDERRIWLFGEISIGVSYINKLLEEEKKCQ